MLGISTKGVSKPNDQRNQVLSLNDLDRRQTDIIMDITNKGVHSWKRNDDGGVDLYYDDMGA
ncbi:MAG TPA: hypothetical protein VE378_06060 [Nitrososphaeraceae archaeon]|nr:hypothetical protein [Nitrososphaeraceae archaeon]